MSSSVQKRVLRAAFMVVVLGLCVRYIARTFAWADIASILGSARLLPFVAAACITLPGYWLLRTWRWQSLLDTVGAPRQRWSVLYLGTVCSLAFALVTPFQAGEALKVELQSNLRKLDGYSCLALERVMDLLSVLLLAAIGLAMNAVHSATLSVATLAMMAVLLVLGSVASAWWVFYHSPWTERFKPLLGSLLAAPGRVAFCMVLSLAGWLMLACGWWGCLFSIGIVLPALEAVSLTAIITLVNVLSFIPGAVGVSEAGIAAVLTQLDCSAPLAQSGALMIRAYGLAALVLGALHFLVWRRLRASLSTVEETA